MNILAAVGSSSGIEAMIACRFQQGYCRHNPRKMVRTWAEKETRNLHRLHRAGVACPQPIYHKDHVVVMSFIGENGW